MCGDGLGIELVARIGLSLGHSSLQMTCLTPSHLLSELHGDIALFGARQRVPARIRDAVVIFHADVVVLQLATLLEGDFRFVGPRAFRRAFRQTPRGLAAEWPPAPQDTRLYALFSPLGQELDSSPRVDASK